MHKDIKVSDVAELFVKHELGDWRNYGADTLEHMLKKHGLLEEGWYYERRAGDYIRFVRPRR